MTQPIEVRLPSGESLRGYIHPAEPARAVVYAHGFGSHCRGDKAEALADECARRGWTYAAFDFRGHGASDGTMRELTASRLVEDLAAIRMDLAGRGYPRLGLVGSSMGGFAAGWYAARNPEAVIGCVLLAPGFRFVARRWDELTPEAQAAWAATGFRRLKNEWVDVDLGYGLVAERAAYEPVDLARRLAVPTLIYHGLADGVVPAADSIAFLQGATYPDMELRLLKAADHRLTGYTAEVAAAACAFLARR